MKKHSKEKDNIESNHGYKFGYIRMGFDVVYVFFNECLCYKANERALQEKGNPCHLL